MFNAIPLPFVLIVLAAASLLAYLTYRAVKNPSGDSFKTRFKGASADLVFAAKQPFVKAKAKVKAAVAKLKAKVKAKLT